MIAGNAGPAQQDYLEDPEIEDVTAEEANASQYSGYQGIPDSPGPAGGVPRDVQQECEDPKSMKSGVLTCVLFVEMYFEWIICS